MPDEKELETQEIENAGNEAEADAESETESEVGDDGEGAAEVHGAEAEDGEEVAAEEKPRSRGEVRFQKLANEAKEAKEEAARVRRELEEFRASQRREAQQESPEQVAQRLALMTPEERMEYKLDQSERRNQQTLAAMQFQTQDMSDKSAFTALCASNPTAARYRDRVEERLTEIRRQGQNVNREALFKFLVGEDVVSKGGSAKAKQARAGAARIEKQAGKPSGARSDAAPNKRGEQSVEDRLANVTF